MSQKIEQWMKDAASVILGRLKYGLAWEAEIAEIIASHAPSGPVCICDGAWPVVLSVYIHAGKEIRCPVHAPSEAAAQPIEVPVTDEYMAKFGGAPGESWSEMTIDNNGVAWVLRSEAEVRIAEALLHPETWNKPEIEHNDH